MAGQGNASTIKTSAPRRRREELPCCSGAPRCWGPPSPLTRGAPHRPHGPLAKTATATVSAVRSPDASCPPLLCLRVLSGPPRASHPCLGGPAAPWRFSPSGSSCSAARSVCTRRGAQQLDDAAPAHSAPASWRAPWASKGGDKPPLARERAGLRQEQRAARPAGAVHCAAARRFAPPSGALMAGFPPPLARQGPSFTQQQQGQAPGVLLHWQPAGTAAPPPAGACHACCR